MIVHVAGIIDTGATLSVRYNPIAVWRRLQHIAGRNCLRRFIGTAYTHNPTTPGRIRVALNDHTSILVGLQFTPERNGKRKRVECITERNYDFAFRTIEEVSTIAIT